ncbi:antibiotic biosynthesis monooxygenase [Sulfitobacter sp. S190]|uniref:antibiotic biosynthesis monooxygenase family protein n=1 Tax=Sulfitobacter sp. S190 TaxID=2867022 RepID=UPI0021A756BA|nr:antibiotic biosynthesis monooxygenase [Sulfitobacter sp. S190]UWR24532.1 antibiotic biosynthesis monooxygenase [Sulfitobacter sp. S190]
MILLINPFTVFDGQTDRFLALWDQTNAIFRASDGFISARLCSALSEQAPGQRAPYTHINVAEWQSRDSYATALRHPDLKRLGGQYMKVCTFNPALYDILRDT